MLTRQEAFGKGWGREAAGEAQENCSATWPCSLRVSGDGVSFWVISDPIILTQESSSCQKCVLLSFIDISESLFI